MGLRAVVFDYGMVLTGPPDQDAHAALVLMSGLPLDRFESLYWADRHAYDEGALNGVTFWQKIAGAAGFALSPEKVAELNHWDARMWGTVNPGMVAWQQALHERGLLTGILSNMGDAVHEALSQAHDWIQRFDVRVWSYQLHMAKPDPAIYLHLLKQLGTRPEETLFIDDKLINIEVAWSLGMKAIEFSTVDRLRADLVAAGLDAELPLPV